MNLQEWKALPKKDWRTEPISPTCQVHIGIIGSSYVMCCSPADKCYPAMRKGWMSLCAAHAKKHTEAFDIQELIASGETFE